MSDEATELVIALAKRVIGQLQVTFPGWRESMFRFVSDTGRSPRTLTRQSNGKQDQPR